MDTNKALEIVSLLSEGIDPYTGEIFSNGVFQHPDTVRALNVAKESLIRLIKLEKRQKELPDNAGMSWSLEEDRQLVLGFDKGTEIKVLAETHKRTEGAVRSRLVRLGRLVF